ncbi:hypothetical protein EZV62_027426 [Acer yangbiense]|uniref:Tf2-1-like SH3-like domain-containing protein n=1 Tax=Acer yangbiense TaxID=1000413 RepID=A0A5C7GUW6_9ROSI|nr:hypothetical protein EZV62_027426 [Acer yangbiense]
MAPYEALYRRKCRSPIHLDKVSERKVLGPKIVQQTCEVIEKIRDRINVAQSRQKSYVDNQRKHFEFATGDNVFLKVAPMKGVMRFGKKGKLRPRFLGMFEILERIDDFAYRLALLPSLARLRSDLTYDEVPIQILDRKVHELRTKKISLVRFYGGIMLLGKQLGSMRMRYQPSILTYSIN